MALSARAQQVQDHITAQGLALVVEELPSSTRTAAEAAASLGCSIAQIVKTLVFRAEDDQPVVVLASGAHRVDEARVASHLGRAIAQADPEYVRQRTGYAIGGVSPFGLPAGTVLIVDEALLTHPVVWAAAGTPRAVVPLGNPLTGLLPSATVLAVA